MAMTSAYKYILPVDDLTEGDKAAFRRAAINAGMLRAIKTKVVTAEDEALVRDADPLTDFATPAGGWATLAFAAVGTLVNAMGLALGAPAQLANNRVAVFYGYWYETLPLAASTLSFREGAAAGSTYAVFNLEQLAARNQTACYFSEPIWYDPQRVMNIVYNPRVVAGVQRMGLMTFIIEPRGPVVSA
jgi:hypothetical protein